MQHFYQPLNHLRPIRRWAQERDARLHLDATSFRLDVGLSDRSVTLVPRFSIRANGRLAYTHKPDSGGFVGWLPYELRQWDAAADKLAFKQACLERGVATPSWDAQPLPGCDCIAKDRRGSFGRGIHGPYRPGNHPPPSLIEAGTFFEAFVFGRAAKAWYWRDAPLAIEVVDPPHVCGDGVRSVGQLMRQPRGSFDRSFDPGPAAQMLAWQGVSLHDVPKQGRRVWLGFKYVTDYDAVVFRDRDALNELPAGIVEQFRQGGPVFRDLIPPAHADLSVYTIDAVIEPSGRVWFLEMNCHPMVHPGVYAPMLSDLFQACDAVRPQGA